MEKASVVVKYGGTWKTSADGEYVYVYEGGDTTAMRVVKGIAYERFVEKLYRIINKDATVYDLEVEVLIHCRNMPATRMKICNDTGLEFFLDEAGGSANGFFPLCVTFVPHSYRCLC
ncbi:hypothetical protein Patl1_07693 [Pistacia atlantica]|uniref:Uncharacterized protein n=1 Tax=Pistacia atlantica TaxID=434234 RepID=A0ACC1ALI3_9ROSI|nr:hypothetical protein Patl1_07693 [Pistacia atlantica]